jgi:flavin-dependent dehydrogenase
MSRCARAPGPAGVASGIRLRSLGLRVALCSHPRAGSMEGRSERSIAALEDAQLERARATALGPFLQVGAGDRRAPWARERLIERRSFDAALLLDAQSAGVRLCTAASSVIQHDNSWHIAIAGGKRLGAGSSLRRAVGARRGVRPTARGFWAPASCCARRFPAGQHCCHGQMGAGRPPTVRVTYGFSSSERRDNFQR